MSDITKCYGDGCLIKHKCRRYTAISNEYRQAYCTQPPIVYYDDGKKMECALFWDDHQTDILQQIEEIVQGKKNEKEGDQ